MSQARHLQLRSHPALTMAKGLGGAGERALPDPAVSALLVLTLRSREEPLPMVGSCPGTSLAGVRCLLCMTPCSSATPNPSEGLVTRSESSYLQRYGLASLASKPVSMPDTPCKAVNKLMLSGAMTVCMQTVGDVFCCVCLASCLKSSTVECEH